LSDSDERNDAPLVVVLSAGSKSERLGLARLNEKKIRLLNVSSGYEAAAEILTRVVSVLVFELSHLSNWHHRLLEIASRRKVPMVAFGTITGVLNGASLKDVHLTGAEQVKQIVEKILSEKSSKARPNDAETSIKSIEASIKDD